MKKIWLIALFFNTLFAASAETELKEQLSENLLYYGILTVPYSHPFVKAAYVGKADKHSFNILASTQNTFENLCIKAQAGNLSAAGALSKLNNPVLSASSSPFSTAQTTVNGITVSAPGTSSLSKPVSYFAQFDFTGRQKKPIAIKGLANLIYIQSNSDFFSFSDNDTFAFSSMLKGSAGKKASFSVSTALGLFPYEQNDSSSWFSKSYYDNFFYEGKHYCQNVQGNILLGNFNSLLSTSVYESPFGSYDWTFRNENRFSRNNLNLSFSQFYSPAQVFTSSQKVTGNMYQAKTSLQYSFVSVMNEKLFLTKTGVGLYYSNKDDENTIKASAGIKCSYKKTSGYLTGAISFSPEDNTFSSLSVQTKISLNEKKIKTSLSGSVSVTPSQEKITANAAGFSGTATEKITLGIGIPNFGNLSGTTTLSLSQKNGEMTKRKITAAISGKLTYKIISVGCKVSADFTF